MQILIVFSHISYFVVSAVHILCIFINADPNDFNNRTDNLNKPEKVAPSDAQKVINTLLGSKGCSNKYTINFVIKYIVCFPMT